jgi:hypothetical protein
MMPFSVSKLDEGFVLASGEDDDGEAEFLQAFRISRTPFTTTFPT